MTPAWMVIIGGVASPNNFGEEKLEEYYGEYGSLLRENLEIIHLHKKVIRFGSGGTSVPPILV
jgi:hypothetical protein